MKEGGTKINNPPHPPNLALEDYFSFLKLSFFSKNSCFRMYRKYSFQWKVIPSLRSWKWKFAWNEYNLVLPQQCYF